MLCNTFKTLFWLGLLGVLFGVLNSCSARSVEVKKKLDSLSFSFFKLDEYYLGEKAISSRYRGTTYHIYSQRKLFEAFWNQTEGLNLAEKSGLWRDYAFSRIGRKFFTEMIMSSSDLDFERDYLRMVKQQLEYYSNEGRSSEIQKFAVALEQSLEMQLRKTIDHFDNFSREIHVVITFVGPVAAKTHNKGGDSNKKIFILNAENLFRHAQEKSPVSITSLFE